MAILCLTLPHPSLYSLALLPSLIILLAFLVITSIYICPNIIFILLDSSILFKKKKNLDREHAYGLHLFPDQGSNQCLWQ